MNLLGSLKYLVALDEHRHFGRAAQACHITQPALSNALRAMEKEFGCAIVLRGRSYVGLTPEGQRVLDSARRMLREHERLRQDLDSGADNPRGALKIGCIPTAMPIAARFAARLQARHPGITPAVLSLSSPEIEAGLENLVLDIGLGYTERLRVLGLHLRVVPQYTEHYFLVRRADRPQASQVQLQPQFGAAISWADASRLPLCLLTPDMHNRTLVDGAFSAAGVVVQPVMETNSIVTLALSAANGAVCSVMPGALVAAFREQHGLEAKPLIRPEMRTPVGFMVHASDQPSRTLSAALLMAQEPAWMGQVAANAGALG
ncbi:MAG: LysR family transcriptional regulator [Burkholderiaceae bacterium]